MEGYKKIHEEAGRSQAPGIREEEEEELPPSRTETPPQSPGERGLGQGDSMGMLQSFEEWPSPPPSSAQPLPTQSRERGGQASPFEFDFECPTPEHSRESPEPYTPGKGHLQREAPPKRAGLWQRVVKRPLENPTPLSTSSTGDSSRRARMDQAAADVRRAARGLLGSAAGIS